MKTYWGLSAVLVLAVSQLVLMEGASAGPMSLEGQFAVSEGGASTFSIPINLAPGTGGVDPKLEIVYNSQGANGALGVGWSLSGLASVTRCAQTVAQDKTKGTINFDANDRFCLDGQRLVAIKGVYGATGTEYRLERDIFSKIISYGVAGSGPAYFKLWTKSGLTVELGNTEDSRIEAQGKTSARVWAANKVTDTNGNYFSVTYTENSINGDFLPKQIDYSGNSRSAMQPNATVGFEYETRPDIVPSYFRGALVRSDLRLSKVRNSVGGVPVREYRISYATSVNSARSLVSGIAECELTRNTCKPQISPSWSGFENKLMPANTWSILKPDFISDVNGDGRPDIVTIGSDGIYVALAGAQGVGSSTKWLNSFGSAQGYADRNVTPITLADIDGDGLSDVVAFASDGIYVALSVRDSFGSPKKWSSEFGSATAWANMDTFPRTFADVNGDGLPDVIGFKADGVYLALNTGLVFSAMTKQLGDFGTLTANPYLNSSEHPRMVFDANGDGFPDIVGFSKTGIYIALGNGVGFSVAKKWTSDFSIDSGWSSHDLYPRTFADVNGDGIPDLVGFKGDGTYLSINTGVILLPAEKILSDFGASTATSYSSQKAFPRYVADMNGDGRADIVGFSANGINVSLSSGNAFGTATRWVSGFDSVSGYDASTGRMLIDVDGDGFPDVLGVKGSAIEVARSAKSDFPDLMTSLASGSGKATSISYRPLTDGSIYTKGVEATFPQVDIVTPTYVVNSVRSSNGLSGGYITTNYRYGGFRGNLQGRGPLGFSWIETTQLNTSIVDTTYYRTDWPYVGMPIRRTKALVGSGSYLNITNFEVGCLGYAAGACLTTAFPYVLGKVEASWDLNGVALPTASMSQIFDAYGNVTSLQNNFGDGSSTLASNVYSNDPVNWILGRLSRSVVTNTLGDYKEPISYLPFNFNIVISASTSNFELQKAAVAAGWKPAIPLIATVTVNPGVTISSASSAPAFDTGFGYPPGSSLVLVNNGSIVGQGGSGGSGITTTWEGPGLTSIAGNGGPAISAGAQITITNNGTIAGGGGGGGAGRGYIIYAPLRVLVASSGGGGGAGSIPGKGGAGGGVVGSTQGVQGLAGSSGSTTTGGLGGGSAFLSGSASVGTNAGGSGGGLGQPGSPGYGGYGGAGAGFPGGNPGAAVIGNKRVTWVSSGVRLGPLQ